MDLNQTWTHIRLWLLFEKFGPSSPMYLPPLAGGGKNALGGPSLNFDRIYLCNGTWYQNWKETCQSTGTPLHAPKFGKLWSRNSWEPLASFCLPPKFLHFETLLALSHGRYITDSRQTLACYVVAGAYSLEQQNARRVHAGLCHASSFISCAHVWLQITQAIQFLHDLGSVQHFQNEFLKSHVVINPQWIVNAMSCIVSVQNTPIVVSVSTS